MRVVEGFLHPRFEVSFCGLGGGEMFSGVTGTLYVDWHALRQK